MVRMIMSSSNIIKYRQYGAMRIEDSESVEMAREVDKESIIRI